MNTRKTKTRALIAEHRRIEDLQAERAQKAAEALAYSEIGGDPQDLRDDNADTDR